MRPRFRTPSSPDGNAPGGPLELVRVRGAQRHPGPEGTNIRARSRRRGGRGRGRRLRPATAPPRRAWWQHLLSLFFSRRPAPPTGPASFDQLESRAVAEFSKHFGITFHDPALLRLALTHRSYLSVTGKGPEASNERLEFLGDSVLGLVTSEYLFRTAPGEHEGQLTKTKSLLVSKAILSKRALAMGLGRFVLMSHSEVESGGRQRLSILADAFESVLGAIYLDQGFEAARRFVHEWLLRGSQEIVADKRHRNYKSHLQEYVQSTFRTHPVYRIRSQAGPDHSKMFLVEVMVGRRVMGEGRGTNKKEAEQAAARDALEGVEKPARREDERRERPARPAPESERRARSEPEPERRARPAPEPERRARPAPEPERRARPEPEPERRAHPTPPGRAEASAPPMERERDGRRSRRARRQSRDEGWVAPQAAAPAPPAPPSVSAPRSREDEEEFEEVGRPEGPRGERAAGDASLEPFGIEASIEPGPVVAEPWAESDEPAWEPSPEPEASPEEDDADESVPERSIEPPAPEPGGAPPGESRFGRRRSRRR